MPRLSTRRSLSVAMLTIFLETGLSSIAGAQQILQVLEPGIGYSRFKQWAIENKLLFENFTKDSLVVRDTGLKVWETIRIQTCFCGGDDYSGKASSIFIQQLFEPKIDAVSVQRDYVEFLAGKANADGKFPGTFSGRRDRKDGNDGLAFSQEGEKGYWEVGLFELKAVDKNSRCSKQPDDVNPFVSRRRILTRSIFFGSSHISCLA
jgi:hypothetical protein